MKYADFSINSEHNLSEMSDRMLADFLNIEHNITMSLAFDTITASIITLKSGVDLSQHAV